MKFIRIGITGSTYGLNGQIKVYPITESPELYEEMKFMLLGRGCEPIKSLEIEDLDVHKDFFLLKFKGIDDKERASELEGLDVLVSDKALPEEESDEVYWYKIEGARVISNSGSPVGTLVDYEETSSFDVFVIELDEGGRALISNNESHVLKIDSEKREIIVNPEGMVREDI